MGLSRQTLFRLALLAVALIIASPATPIAHAAGHRAGPHARFNGPPASGSGAGLAYPLNHTLDTTAIAVGAPPTNSGFEAAPASVGTPPANSDFSALPGPAGTPPQNSDFESGDFSGWVTTGAPAPTIETTHTTFAKLATGSAASVTSAAFTPAASAQTIALNLGYLTTNGYSEALVYVLSGANFATSTQVGDFACFACGAWATVSVDATAYAGQTIEVQVMQLRGDVGVDNLSAQVVLPSYTVTGAVSRATEAGGNAYARLDPGGAILSSAFTLDGSAQSFSLRLDGLNWQAAYTLNLLSGANFGTSTQLVFGGGLDLGWQTLRFSASSWAGQQVKLQVVQYGGSGVVGVDDLGLQRVDVPGWGVSGTPIGGQANDTSLVTGAPGGQAVRTNGTLTSSAFTLAATAQQLAVDYKGDSPGDTFSIEILSGANFATVTDVTGGLSPADTSWHTFKANVTSWQGQTVKLRLRGYYGYHQFDNAGPSESILPGWTVLDYTAVAGGVDAGGSYITRDGGGTSGSLRVQSAVIQTNIVSPFGGGAQPFAVAYDIGYSPSNTITVNWVNAATGQPTAVFSDAASSPTGPRLAYFAVLDSMGATGSFIVTLANGGKLYSLADNVARQQLAEPFSQKVGLQIDTSTGAFGFQEQDLSLGGPQPLSLTRYYSGQSDRFGSLGYRWSQSYDTRLYLGSNGAGVVFGSGKEAFFNWYGPTQTYTAADSRVHDTLAKNGDSTYSYTTTANLAYLFSAAGVLQRVTDQAGNATVLSYGGSSRLSVVTDPGGRTLTFAYDASNRLTSVTDPTNAAERYAYDANGDLHTATDPLGGVRTYSYTNHLLVSVVDQNGKTLFTNAYDATNRVVTQSDALGKAITLAYSTPSAGITRVTDPNGGQAFSYFDLKHRTTDKVDPLGHDVSYIYDSAGNVQKVIDPANDAFQFAYDAAGMPTSSTDPLNNAIQIAYSPKHLPTTITDALGHTTTLVYDTAGNLTSKTDPLNQTTTKRG